MPTVVKRMKNPWWFCSQSSMTYYSFQVCHRPKKTFPSKVTIFTWNVFIYLLKFRKKSMLYFVGPMPFPPRYIGSSAPRPRMLLDWITPMHPNSYTTNVEYKIEYILKTKNRAKKNSRTKKICSRVLRIFPVNLATFKQKKC